MEGITPQWHHSEFSRAKKGYRREVQYASHTKGVFDFLWCNVRQAGKGLP